MKLLAIPASNSKKSINKSLLGYAATLVENSNASILDLNDYEMPIYNIDLEEAHGIPDAATKLRQEIGDADAIVISLAEHNGSYTAAFKNTLDWMSRIDRDIFQSKKMILLATSPGPGGASRVLEFATTSMPFFGGEVIDSFSLPSFYDNFSYEENVIKDKELDKQLAATMRKLNA